MLNSEEDKGREKAFQFALRHGVPQVAYIDLSTCQDI